ncbi:MAG: transposase [Opitutaceae bacterium]|nr:transposase [Opitutaceae bacterium]
MMKQVAGESEALLGRHADCALYVDETSFAKKGDKSVGVKRQYCGRLGNAGGLRPQFASFTASASRRGGNRMSGPAGVGFPARRRHATMCAQASSQKRFHRLNQNHETTLGFDCRAHPHYRDLFIEHGRHLRDAG